MATKILIVDDNANMRTTLADILEEKGYEVVESGDGKEALDKVNIEKPDIVLLDTRMPSLDGYEVCKRIKKIEGLTVGVVIYTGYVDAVDAGKARESGADDYVVKTSDFSLLLQAIEKLV